MAVALRHSVLLQEDFRPGKLWPDHARALSEAPRRKRLSGAGQRVPGRFR